MTERILRFFLALTPGAFRSQEGDELLAVHRMRMAAARSARARAVLSLREILGMIRLVVRIRLEGGGTGRRAAGPSSRTGGSGFLQDIRFGLRTIRRHPGFSFSIVLVLALGIGATTAIFSAANAYLFRPLPFREAHRLVRIFETNPEFAWDFADAAPANVLDWREQVDAFEDVAVYTEWVTQATWVQDGEARLVGTTSVSGNFFQVLGVPPALGRTFRWEETWSPHDQVVVLSHELWVDRFGSDPAVVGRTLEFVGGSARVVGVMPAGFSFPSAGVDLWTPWGWNPEDREAPWFRRAHWVKPIARLAPGRSLEEADAQLQVVVDRLQVQYPETNKVMGAGLMPLRAFLIREVRTPLRVLLGAVGLLLLLACANVANLLLVRGTERAREVSLRFAMGAARGRVVRQLLTENALLALLGGLGGLGLGWLGVNLMEGLVPIGIDGATEIALDHRVLLFTLGTAVISGAVFGLVPSLRSADSGLTGALKDGAVAGGWGRSTHRTVNVLVAAEVALALLLASAGTLMVRSFVYLRNVDPGFRVEGTVAAQLSLPSARYPGRGEVLAFYDQLLERLRARQGILAAGTVGNLPLNGANWSSQFQAEGWPADRVGFEILHRRADRGYFEALDIPLIRGRLFEPTDEPGGPLVVVINQTLADQHFSGEDPIGQKIAYDRAADESSFWYEIIGIVGDQHQVSPGQAPRAEVFENRNQDWGRDSWIVMKTPGDPASAIPVLRGVLEELDPLLPLTSVRSLQEVWRSSLAEERFLLTLLSIFGIVAVTLAGVGVYGVTAQAARKRTREIGIRMALGAADGDVVTFMVRRGMVVVGLGTVGGLGLTLIGARALGTLLHGIAPNDPLTLLGVAAGLGLVAFLASFVPARKASSVDPVDSLRAE